MEIEQTMQQMLQQLLANQAEMKADQTKGKANQEDLLVRM
jgi:hypothetical protein